MSSRELTENTNFHEIDNDKFLRVKLGAIRAAIKAVDEVGHLEDRLVSRERMHPEIGQHSSDLRRYINNELQKIIALLQGSQQQLNFRVASDIEVTDGSLEPGEEIVLDEVIPYSGSEGGQNVGFGNSERIVTLDDIAASLNQEGSILKPGGALYISERPHPFDEERELEEINKSLDLLLHDLKFWHNSRDYDREEIRELRAQRYEESTTLIAKLINRADSINHRLVLITGEQEIHTVTLGRTPYDMPIERSGKKIPPQDKLILTKADGPYVGDYYKVKLSELAAALSEGATITVVSKDELEEEPEEE